MINKTIWLSIDQETREKIAKDWGMVKTEGCSVVGNRVMSDGYSNETLMMITEEGLNERLSKTQKTLPQGFMKKWEYYVSDIRGDEVQYSNDDVLDKSEELQPEDLKQVEEVKPKFVIKRTQEEINNIVDTLKKKSEPKKKMGRPKGSKKKKK